MATKVKKVGQISVKVVTDAASIQKKPFISESDIEMDNRARAAVRSAIDRAKVCKKPIAKYDPKNKRAYVEYADGEKKYVN